MPLEDEFDSVKVAPIGVAQKPKRPRKRGVMFNVPDDDSVPEKNARPCFPRCRFKIGQAVCFDAPRPFGLPSADAIFYSALPPAPTGSAATVVLCRIRLQHMTGAQLLSSAKRVLPGGVLSGTPSEAQPELAHEIFSPETGRYSGRHSSTLTTSKLLSTRPAVPPPRKASSFNAKGFSPRAAPCSTLTRSRRCHSRRPLGLC